MPSAFLHVFRFQIDVSDGSFVDGVSNGDGDDEYRRGGGESEKR